MAVSTNFGTVCCDSGKSGDGVVAADVSSAGKGWRPAARKKRWQMSAVLKCFSLVRVGDGFIRRAGSPPLHLRQALNVSERNFANSLRTRFPPAFLHSFL